MAVLHGGAALGLAHSVSGGGGPGAHVVVGGANIVAQGGTEWSSCGLVLWSGTAPCARPKKQHGPTQHSSLMWPRRPRDTAGWSQGAQPPRWCSSSWDDTPRWPGDNSAWSGRRGCVCLHSWLSCTVQHAIPLGTGSCTGSTQTLSACWTLTTLSLLGLSPSTGILLSLQAPPHLWSVM